MRMLSEHLDRVIFAFVRLSLFRNEADGAMHESIGLLFHVRIRLLDQFVCLP